MFMNEKLAEIHVYVYFQVCLKNGDPIDVMILVALRVRDIINSIGAPTTTREWSSKVLVTFKFSSQNLMNFQRYCKTHIEFEACFIFDRNTQRLLFEWWILSFRTVTIVVSEIQYSASSFVLFSKVRHNGKRLFFHFILFFLKGCAVYF